MTCYVINRHQDTSSCIIIGVCGSVAPYDTTHAHSESARIPIVKTIQTVNSHVMSRDIINPEKWVWLVIEQEVWSVSHADMGEWGQCEPRVCVNM